MYTSSSEGPLSSADVAVLHALFELGRRGRPVRMPAVARLAGVSGAVADASLLHLERHGLVWSARARLTLSGLALAARLAARALSVGRRHAA